MVGPIARTERRSHFRIARAAASIRRPPGRRIAFDVTNSTFSSHDIMLAGARHAAGSGSVPVVFCCMARDMIALTDYFLQRMLPAQVSGVFCMTSEAPEHPGVPTARTSACWPTMRSRRCAKTRRLAGARLSRSAIMGRQSGRMGGPDRGQSCAKRFCHRLFRAASVSSTKTVKKLKLKCARKALAAEIAQALESLARRNR